MLITKGIVAVIAISCCAVVGTPQQPPQFEQKITTATAYNDGKWHHVVGTQSAAGIKFFVDGITVGTNPQATAQAYNGYWRLGGGNLTNSSPGRNRSGSSLGTPACGFNTT